MFEAQLIAVVICAVAVTALFKLRKTSLNRRMASNVERQMQRN
jgi:hypothetical protein